MDGKINVKFLLVLKRKVSMKKLALLGIVAFSLSLGAYDTASTEKIYSSEQIKIPDSQHIQFLSLKDGSTIIGRVIEIKENEIQFETEIGTMTIPILKIENIKEIPVSPTRKKEYWFPNPNTTRLFLGPTGRTLKKGNCYFSDVYLFFPLIAYGVTDYITISGGVSLFPGVGGDQLLYLAPKVKLISTDKFNLSTGSLIIKPPSFGSDDTPLIGMLYGVGTYGTHDANATFGLGYGFVDKDFAEEPMLMLGGELRQSRNTAFVTENWFLPGMNSPLFSLGIRFFGRNLSVDLAFFTWIYDNEIFFPPIPYVDFVYNF
jgi:hypothetical protein